MLRCARHCGCCWCALPWPRPMRAFNAGLASTVPLRGRRVRP
jgi:hypothetical protein